MGDVLDREQRVARARRAEALLEDPLLKEVFEAADADAVRDWRDATTVEGREEAWARARGLREAQQRLRAILADGQQAQAYLERERKRPIRV